MRRSTSGAYRGPVAGDWVLLYYSTPAQTQEARVQVLASGLTSTQFQYSLGSTTFATSSGFGWAAIENAAIEDETDGLKLIDIKFQGGPVASALILWATWFTYGATRGRRPYRTSITWKRRCNAEATASAMLRETRCMSRTR